MPVPVPPEPSPQRPEGPAELGREAVAGTEELRSGLGSSAEELRHRALTGVVSVAFRGITVRVMSLLANVVLARELAPRDFGLLAFGVSIVAVGGFFTSGGLGAALIRQREDPSRHQLEAVFGVQLLITSVVVLLAAGIGIPLGTAGAVAAIMTVSLPIDALRVAPALLLQRELRYTPIVRSEIGEMLSYNVIAVVAVLLGAGIWGVAAAVVCRAVTGSILLMTAGAVGLLRPRIDFSVVKPLWRFGVVLQANNLTQLIRGQGLNFATSGLGGVAVLGIWSFGIRLLQPIQLLFESVSRVAFPAVAGLMRAGEDPKPLIERGLRLSYGVTGLGVAALAAALPAGVPSIFGAQWDPAVDMLPWALAGLLLSGPMVSCATAYLATIGEAGQILRSSIVHSIGWVVLSLALLPSLGAVALAMGWALAGVIDVLMLGRSLQRRLGLGVVASLTPAVLLVVASAPLGWLFESQLGTTAPVAALSATAAAAVYAVGLAVLQPSTAREILRISGKLAATTLARRRKPAPLTA